MKTKSDKVRVTVSLDADVHRLLMQLSKASSSSISALLAGFVPDEKVLRSLIDNKHFFKAIPEEIINEAMYSVMSELIKEINRLHHDSPCEFTVKKKEKAE
ncbi:hypothetical protein MU985_005387, partial [Salmonella enterica]|nr:hypothetical protein [Salmonella enterica]EJA5054828.1 hypothetical protein [Salmonella enterica]EJA5151648.1 hypothetical protein [Salmonella enterica]EJU3354852.1 hypothetical protein [Salmonella enterica]EJX4295386.1 hypothetical protein [Salmonella enterica]